MPAAELQDSLFDKIDEQRVEALNITVESYRHQKTGARHLHLASDDGHNAFLVAFLTVPSDSSGVAHVLEHTALCGSERYPVRDPFFMMLRRSLATFMNAFTSSDWTAYPFASQSRKDFFNLLDVYLDAAFFPNLHPLDFAQEGHRVCFEEQDDPESELVFKGVVFNEMKGAMSSAARVLWEQMGRFLFPTITYHHNSGGSPERIPDLTYQGLKDFHATHYHPTNAIFMTYGDISAREHQTIFEHRVLNRFEHLDVSHLSVPDEQRYSTPRQEESVYALDAETDPAGKTHVVLSWLLGKSVDLDMLLQAHFLNGILLDNSASPLLQALETTELGSAPSPACGMDDSVREMVFACGVEGSEPERADAVEALILGVLEKIVEEGVPQESVDSVLHQLELSRREIGGDGFPYGLKMMLTALPFALHGGNPVQALALEEALEKLRESASDPDFSRHLVKTLLLDNPHRVRLVLKPDTELDEQRKQAEAARLAAMKVAMSDEEKQAVITLNKELDARQAQDDDPEVLPKVTLDDVPEEMTIPVGSSKPVGDIPAWWYDRPTNGLVYQQTIVDLPALEPDLVDVMPLFSACLAEVGCGERSYLETQAWQSSISGGVGARATVRSEVNSLEGHQGYFVISSKALVRNQEEMIALLGDTFSNARFDEHNRIRELVTQMRAMSEMKVVDNGHVLAMSAASAGMSQMSNLSEHWGGLQAISRLKKLDEALKSPDAVADLADRFQRIQQQLVAMDPNLLVIGERRHFSDVEASLKSQWHKPTGDRSARFQWNAQCSKVNVAWMVSSQVQFCARVFPAVPYGHSDAPVMTVLGHFLRNGYLHRAIREQGGAYGGGAGYDSDAGAFRFYSYRDPRLAETLEDFDRSLDWLLSEKHEPRKLEEAILGVISAIDRPGSPAGEARRAFHEALHGRSADRRQVFRQRVLATTLEDLVRVGETYLKPQLASTAVVAGSAAQSACESLGLECYKL
ncbi:MAG: insulinase family protein [Magnetococcales bacterium]|nr:insulinase family protein [Magnetococcales bacterium]